MANHLVEAGLRYAPTLGDPLQERADFVGVLGSPERDQEDRVCGYHSMRMQTSSPRSSTGRTVNGSPSLGSTQSPVPRSKQ